MRLDKCLEKAKIGSKGQVKKLWKQGLVTIDGHPAKRLNQIVDPQLQVIKVEEKRISATAYAYYMLNKPKGVVSAVRDDQHETVLDCLKTEDRVVGLYPIGRLDRDTEGLLLLTNNGPLGYRLLHPRHHVTKTYEVKVNGPLSIDAVDFFKAGVSFLDGTRCQPAELEIISSSERQSQARVTVSEGKFHQIKKMFLAYGVKVIDLKRLSFGDFSLDQELQAGEYRPLRAEELEVIKSYLD